MKIGEIAKEKFGIEVDNYYLPRESTNSVYIIESREEKYCIKISGKYQGASRAEPLIQEKVRTRTKIPTPEVIEKNYEDKVMFLMEYIEGKNGRDCVKKAKDNLQELESYYKELNKIELPNFGYMNWDSEKGFNIFPKYETWKETLEHEVSIMCDYMRDNRFKYLADFHEKFFNKNKHILDDYNFKPVIVNSDYRLENVIIKDGDINAVLDWGSCFSGDIRFGLKKTEFLLGNFTTELPYSTEIEEKLSKFYDALIWMYMMGGFEKWFKDSSSKEKSNLEAKIRLEYRKDVEKVS